MSDLNPADIPSHECACDPCRSACKFRPGWFLPGEAEKTAAMLGTTIEDLFLTRLAADWYEDLDGDNDDEFYYKVMVLAPALEGEPTGDEYPEDPIGRCGLLTPDGRCSIHDAKPFECRAYLHSDTPKVTQQRHDEIARAWIPYQGQIQALLKLGSHDV